METGPRWGACLMMEEFFTIHAGLPRQGPGETSDVAWAAEQAGVKPDAAICDAGSGPGGDVGALLRAASLGHVTAIDMHAPFIEEAKTRFGQNPRVTLIAGDMAEISGPFDFIWSAGAAYFLGVEGALTLWRKALAAGGAVAFSEPCLFTDTPSDGAIAMWDGYPRLTDAAGIAEQVAAAGFETIATKPVSDIGWESYYRPIEARVAELRIGADAAMTQALDAEEREIALWRAHRAETGYLLSVVRPL